MLPYTLWLLLVAQLSLAALSRPNILFVLTDDQDWHMESVDHMKYLKVRHRAVRVHRDPSVLMS